MSHELSCARRSNWPKPACAAIAADRSVAWSSTRENRRPRRQPRHLDQRPDRARRGTAIRDACATLQTFQLTDCELYTSCEPCPIASPRFTGRAFRRCSTATRAPTRPHRLRRRFHLPADSPVPEQRTVAMQPLLHDEAKVAFAEWARRRTKCGIEPARARGAQKRFWRSRGRPSLSGHGPPLALPWCASGSSADCRSHLVVSSIRADDPPKTPSADAKPSAVEKRSLRSRHDSPPDLIRPGRNFRPAK